MTGLGACDSSASDGSEPLDWPTASPPEGWVVTEYPSEPGAVSDPDPTALLVHRDDVELGGRAFSSDGSPIVRITVLSPVKGPEELIEKAFNAPSDTDKSGLARKSWTDS